MATNHGGARPGAGRSRVRISGADGKALRDMLMERHGYSAKEALPALLSGELLTVLLPPDELPHLAAWLEAQAETADPMLSDTLRSLARQLSR